MDAGRAVTVPDISAVVLCCNEDVNIRHCLQSVHDFCDVFVVDSGSTDQTVQICREFTSNIYSHEYVNHATQWQWALTELPLHTEWVLALDADFVVSDRLKADLAERLPFLEDDVAGLYVRHRYVFGGGAIRFGGTKQYWLRVVRVKRASADTSDLVDFRFVVQGKTERLRSDVTEYNRHDDDISTWLRKQDKFSLRLAIEEELRRRRALAWQKAPRFFGNSDERITWLRDRWLSLPLFVRPVLYFLYRYVLALGFVDGRAGFLYHFLQGWWLRTVVDWKILSMRRLAMTPGQFEQFKAAALKSNTGSVEVVAMQALSMGPPSE